MKKIGILMVALLALSGCGSSGADSNAAAAKAKASKEASASAAASQSAAAEADVKARAQEAYDTCVSLTKPTLTALQDVNSRLNVGLIEHDYSEKLGDIRVAYDTMDKASGGASAGCVAMVMEKLRKAYNAHAAADTVWSDCISDYNCDATKAPTIDKMRGGWNKAQKLTNNADSALAKLAPEQ